MEAEREAKLIGDWTAPWSTPVYTVPAETVTPDKLTFDEYRAERERLIAECKANGCLNHDNRAWDDPWWAFVPPLFNLNQCNKYHEQIAALDARYKAQATPGDEDEAHRLYSLDGSNLANNGYVWLTMGLARGRELERAELRGKVEQTIRMLADRDILRPIDLLRDFAAKLLGESK